MPAPSSSCGRIVESRYTAVINSWVRFGRVVEVDVNAGELEDALGVGVAGPSDRDEARRERIRVFLHPQVAVRLQLPEGGRVDALLDLGDEGLRPLPEHHVDSFLRRFDRAPLHPWEVGRIGCQTNAYTHGEADA